MASKELLTGVGVAALLGVAVLGVFFAGRSLGRQEGAVKPPVVSQPKPIVPATNPQPVQNPPEGGATQVGASEATDFDSLWNRLVGLMHEKGMKPVAELNGNGTAQSVRFDVATNDQYLVWGLDPETKIRVLTISPSRDGRPVDTVAPDASKEWNGASWLHMEPGTYYLDVMATGKWKVNVYEK